jgi:uncharacterized protein (TIGR03000 family)
MILAAGLALLLGTASEAKAQWVGYGGGRVGWGWGNPGYYGYGPGYSYSGWPGYRSSYYYGPTWWGPGYRTSYYSSPSYYSAPAYYSMPSYSYSRPVQYAVSTQVESGAPARGHAQVRVLVPADAVVTFDGNATRQTGTDRLFVTPPLEAGRNYIYQIRAEWLESGQKVTRSVDRDIHAGDMINVDFLTQREGVDRSVNTVPPRTDSPRTGNDAARPDRIAPTTIRPAGDVTTPPNPNVPITPAPASTVPVVPGVPNPNPLPANNPPNPNPLPPNPR